MAAQPSDLVSRAQRGDRGALDQLLREHQDLIYRFGLRFCKNAADAEDVLQETMLVLAEKVGDFRGEASLSSWLYAVARSMCQKRRRKSKFAPRAFSSTQDAPALALADQAAAPDAIAVGLQLEDALAQALAGLEETDREVLVLRDFEGMSAKQVADAIESSVPAVKSRLHRARNALRAALSPYVAGGASSSSAEAAGGDEDRSGCPDIGALFSEELEGDVAPELCERMRRHVAGCSGCKSVCDELSRTLQLCSQAAKTPVPEEVAESVRQALRAWQAQSD